MTVLNELRGRGSVYFLRHGQTDGHVPGLMKGRGRQPLSAEGREQATAAGEWLAGRGITRILSSPLTRAHQTADIVAARLGLKTVTDWPLLIEIDIGIFTGLTRRQAAVSHPEVLAAFERNGWDAVPGAEKAAALHARAVALWRELGTLTAAGASSLLCVIHKGIFQWIMRVTFGCATPLPLVEIDSCSVYRLSYDICEGRRYTAWDILNLAPWRGTRPTA